MNGYISTGKHSSTPVHAKATTTLPILAGSMTRKMIDLCRLDVSVRNTLFISQFTLLEYIF
jgi:hypothetical protein